MMIPAVRVPFGGNGIEAIPDFREADLLFRQIAQRMRLHAGGSAKSSHIYGQERPANAPCLGFKSNATPCRRSAKPYLDGSEGPGQGDHRAGAVSFVASYFLGSRLIDRQSQDMTVAARATAERKVFAHLS